MPSIPLAPVHPQTLVPLLDDAADADDLALLDEQLLAAAADFGKPEDAEAHPVVYQALASVRIPTVCALRTASLRALRATIARTSEDSDPQRWASLHLILGLALRMRAGRLRGHRRANLLIQATRAFDVAFTVYAALRAMVAQDQFISDGFDSDFRFSEVGRSHRRAGARMGECARERDGMVLVARAVTGPFDDTAYMLERAIEHLRSARAMSAAHSWSWISNTNNLACALTLLGNRNPAPSGSAMLREAAQVLGEALKACGSPEWRAGRASTLINLAEALLSMAERETPGTRLKKIERALSASSVALLTVAPPEWASLLQLTHVTFDY